MQDNKEVTDFDEILLRDAVVKQVNFIKEIVARYFKESATVFDEKGKPERLIKLRHHAIYLTTQLVKIKIKNNKGLYKPPSLAFIGTLFGCDHANVLYIKRVYNDRLMWDKDLEKELKEISKIIDYKFKILENSTDLSENYTFVDLNNCTVAKIKKDKSIVFAGYSKDEINDVLNNLGYSETSTVEFNNTTMYLIKDN